MEVRNRVFLNLLLVFELTLPSVTEEVQDYVLCYTHNNTLYEIHLIDSPGFDDGTVNDSQVLSEIATYVNTHYMLKVRLAGVLYLHDITKGKLGGVGQRNLRMLEKMIGQEKYSNCTLVTTKWGCTKNSQDEEEREKTLREVERYFGGMLSNAQHARMERFDPMNRAKALEIIAPYLENQFTPLISQQMVDPQGPRLSLGETEAGKIIADDLEKLEQKNLELENVRLAQDILSQKYDETLFSDFKQKRKALRRKIRTKRSGRWIMRTIIVGGAITATILTAGPGASTFVLVPLVEQVMGRQKKAEKEQREDLEAQFVKESQNANKLKEVSPGWLWDMNVQQLKDTKVYNLSGEVAVKSLANIVRRGGLVEIIASDGCGARLDAANLTGSDSESESDSGKK